MKNIIIILSILFYSFSSEAFDENDLITLKNTKICINCDLSNANLGGMNLKNSNLKGSTLKGSILIGTDLSYSNLLNGNLDSAFIRSTNFCNTIMPAGNISIDGCSNKEIIK
jgi:BTB/POZ domain-containing protein KCTD9